MHGEQVGTIVVGGGQAGLAVGRELARRGLPFTILDASRRVGDAWRSRWDTLRLFSPARYCGLPGMRFPAPGGSLPGKDAMADYLEAYAARLRLPVRSGVRVERVWREGERFMVEAGGQRLEADQVIVAMANFQRPRVPDFAEALAPAVRQLHSLEYRDPAQLPPGPVLVVGAGNSGADIAMELAQTRPTLLSGKEAGHIPFPIDGLAGRLVLSRLVRFVGHHVLTVRTPVGRRHRPSLLRSATPLVRVKPADLVAAGVERVARVAGVQDGRPLLADGRVLDVAGVVWCTGFHPGFSWIDLPAFGEDGEPLHDRGVVASQPGLYFVGLHFLFAMTSATVTGVGRDARRIARAVAARVREGRRAEARRRLRPAGGPAAAT
jgi:putative flavoprotein involved in K+ transport